MDIGVTVDSLPGRGGRSSVKQMLDLAPGQWVAVRKDVSYALAAAYRKAKWSQGQYEFSVRKIDGTKWLFGRRHTFEQVVKVEPAAPVAPPAMPVPSAPPVAAVPAASGVVGREVAAAAVAPVAPPVVPPVTVVVPPAPVAAPAPAPVAAPVAAPAPVAVPASGWSEPDPF